MSTTTTRMTIKLGIKSHSPLSKWLHEVTWQIKYLMSLLPQGVWPLRDFTHKVTQRFKYMVFRDHLTNQKSLISTTTVPEATNVSSMVAYGKGLPTIKSYDHLNKWLCEVTGKIKNIKSHLSQYLSSPNLLGGDSLREPPILKVTWSFNLLYLLNLELFLFLLSFLLVN